jgi:hypothetical protein
VQLAIPIGIGWSSAARTPIDSGYWRQRTGPVALRSP